MRHVAAQIGTVLVVGVQLLNREESGFCQCGIHGRAGVALAQNESIPVGMLRFGRIDVQHAAIEHCQNVGHGKGRADVRTTASTRHVQGVEADSFGKIFGIHMAGHVSPRTSAGSRLGSIRYVERYFHDA